MNSCLFVGIDTHKDSHTAAVLDGYFDVVSTVTFTNDKEGFAHLEARIKKRSHAEERSSSAWRTARAWEAFLPHTL
jgi:hypothetical protein